MLTSRSRSLRRWAAASALSGLLLAGAAAAPAQAQSARSKQWFLDAMKADQMWQTSTGKGITVAVIDTGVDADHPDLKGRVLKGEDLATNKPGGQHTDYDGHGTNMAGLIAGSGSNAGGTGAFGLAPGARILPVRLPRSEGLTQTQGNKQLIGAVAKGIRYAADAGAQVINISQGATAGSTQLSSAVRYALNKGSLIFAAVGNSGNAGNLTEYPAATPGVVGVAAVGKDLKRTEESEYGPQVDMAAPGEDMVAACTSKTHLCRGHGTSDATAIASASAALIWSAHPKWTNNQVLRVMLNTIGAPVDGSKRTNSIGYGIVRPRVALKNPGDPGPANKYPLPDLAAATPSSSPSAGAAGSSKTDEAQKPDDSTTSNKQSSNTGLWVGLGIGAAVLLGVVAVFAVVRSRRRSQAASTRPAQAGPFPYPDEHARFNTRGGK
ncbi:type VII secretion-associated serine protease mycosin [Streptomyces beihaiensis]|uniref:Type VII secretion-associated serine protease mycosin n=1 Tax=Streptomyces beihaiensis TaxID=2984495 RepID=A0ABT3TQC8_9ACTN|nr:type VII secretion-associated serine protease mycosin [Streptomyces beihaiensis]MCX3058711.1 type VII secretion-associated serine protease mycosin [Streptomyces beihaiensis]